jgi:hypothetical protein
MERKGDYAKMKAENCIFIPNTDKQKETTTDNSTCFYTLLGHQDFIDDESKPRLKQDGKFTYAKSSTKNDTTKYYIKVGTYGRIFNPIGLFSEGKSNKFVAKIGKKEFEFKEVNPKIFNMYTTFLATKNIAWLNNAEREMV